jgi:hypothetical protein
VSGCAGVDARHLLSYELIQSTPAVRIVFCSLPAFLSSSHHCCVPTGGHPHPNQPQVAVLSAVHSIRLYRVTDPGNSTVIELSSDFSSDASNEVLADRSLTHPFLLGCAGLDSSPLLLLCFSPQQIQES